MSDNDNKCGNTALVLYTGVSLIAITVLIIVLYKCDNRVCDTYQSGSKYSNKRGDIPPLPPPGGWDRGGWFNRAMRTAQTPFTQPYPPPSRHKIDDGKPDLCLCAGSGKVCANKANLLNSYLDGNTEFQDFTTIQKQLGGPFWKNTNFDQY